MCNGGTISNNILNGQVEITECKGIVFKANHLESYVNAGMTRSAQLGIFNSAISVISNYFEKGKCPSVIIKGTYNNNIGNVVLSDNTFVSCSVMNIIGNSGNVSDAHLEWMNNLSEYDIVISKNANIRITNCFRNWLALQGSGVSIPTGLMFQISNNDNILFEESAQTLQDYADFNDYSYAFSRECKISNGKIMDAAFSVNNTNPSISHAITVNSNNYWLKPNSRCVYSFEIIWDKTRRIIGNNTSYPLNNDNNPKYVILNSRSVVLITIRTGENNNFNLRVFRKRQESNITKYEYVDVPVCGGIYFYDDGISLNGYKWKECNNWKQVEIGPSITTIKNIRRFGDNVQCNATGTGTLTDWTKGDILFNVGTDSSWQVYIRQ